MMKRLIKGFFMSFGMFCSIPSLFHKWDESCANLIMPCFPLVGAVVGLLWYGASLFFTIWSIHRVMIAALIALIPFLLTGFIHLDGYMDTSDALLSRRPLDDKLRILKDPHTGAFAVVMLAVLFLLSFAAVYAAIDLGRDLRMLIFVPITSRCFTALALLKLSTLAQSGYGALFKENTGKRHVFSVIAMGLITFFASYAVCGLRAVICLLFSLLGFAVAISSSYRELKGISGDLSGHALVVCELCGLMAWAVI